MARDKEDQGLYILMLSIHGLVRGHDIELGRDADTGGQVKYVVELARALAEHPRVDKVDLLTRRVAGERVDPCYDESEEDLGKGARILRIDCGPKGYIRKERLWHHLNSFVDQALQHIRRTGRVPDVVHGHYADAGYAGANLARLLGVPFIFTGHSLGRVKRARLMEKGLTESEIEKEYSMSTRIEGEETALDTAELVVASTQQEVEEQYQPYDHYVPERMEVIAPGVDLDRFRPPSEEDPAAPIESVIARFLKNPERPAILAMARPDERKNFPALIQAYAEHPGLREKANLVLIAGNRERLDELDPASRKVLRMILGLIDDYDLHGRVAYPKHHLPDEVPEIYRFAARTRGVFVNPALTEPFGLTLLEAAASGLPVVATNDGGPRDIIGACRNGVLVDPLKPGEIGKAIWKMLDDAARWEKRAKAGVTGVTRHFSWESHVRHYLGEVRRVLRGRRPGSYILDTPRSRLTTVDRLIITDIDNTLTGNSAALARFKKRLQGAASRVGFGIATGRTPKATLAVLQKLGLPAPDVLVTCVGTEIYYGPKLTYDTSWKQHIDYQWKPGAIVDAMQNCPGLTLQPPSEQRPYKISYLVDTTKAPDFKGIVRHLRHQQLRVRPILSHQAYLDITPIRASAGQALRYIAFKWGLPTERLLVAGDSGNDEDMLRGDTLGVVVGNYSKELENLRGRPRIYFAEGTHADGILEGLDYYDFLGDVKIPQEQG